MEPNGNPIEYPQVTIGGVAYELRATYFCSRIAGKAGAYTTPEEFKALDDDGKTWQQFKVAACLAGRGDGDAWRPVLGLSPRDSAEKIRQAVDELAAKFEATIYRFEATLLMDAISTAHTKAAQFGKTPAAEPPKVATPATTETETTVIN